MTVTVLSTGPASGPHSSRESYVALHMLQSGMTRIGVRELRQNASRYLALVKAGQVVDVTERGTLIARLVPPTPAMTERERLIATGRLVGAKSEFRLPERLVVGEGGPSTSVVLDDLREERLP